MLIESPSAIAARSGFLLCRVSQSRSWSVATIVANRDSHGRSRRAIGGREIELTRAILGVPQVRLPCRCSRAPPAVAYAFLRASLAKPK